MGIRHESPRYTLRLRHFSVTGGNCSGASAHRNQVTNATNGIHGIRAATLRLKEFIKLPIAERSLGQDMGHFSRGERLYSQVMI